MWRTAPLLRHPLLLDGVGVDAGVDEAAVGGEEVAAEGFVEGDGGLEGGGDLARDHEVAEDDASAGGGGVSDFGEEAGGFFFAHELADVGEGEALDAAGGLGGEPLLRGGGDVLDAVEAGFDDGEVFGEQIGGDGGVVEVVAAEEEGKEVVGGEGDLADGAAGAAEEAFGEGCGAVVEFEVVDGHALVEDAFADEDFEEEAPLGGVPVLVEVGLLLGYSLAGEEAVDALAALEEADDAGEEGDEGFEAAGVDDAILDGFWLGEPVGEGGGGEVGAETLEGLRAGGGRGVAEEGEELLGREVADCGGFELEEVGLGGVDVDGVDAGGVFEQEGEGVAAAGGDGEEGVGGGDAEGAGVGGGVFPTAAEEEVEEVDLVAGVGGHGCAPAVRWRCGDVARGSETRVADVEGRGKRFCEGKCKSKGNGNCGGPSLCSG